MPAAPTIALWFCASLLRAGAILIGRKYLHSFAPIHARKHALAHTHVQNVTNKQIKKKKEAK